MANTTIKAETVISQMLGVLERETVLAQFVSRSIPDTAFRGAKDDTVSIRLPAYVTARTRVMRSGSAITIDEFDETKVDVSLATHVYKAIGISSEELTLDITNFGEQVTAPAMNAVVRKVDDSLATLMSGSTYQVERSLVYADPYKGIVQARIDLNNANVPANGRFLAVGSNVELALLSSDRLSKVDTSGSSETLREAVIGRVAGFTAISAPGLDPDIAIAGHRTAFVLATVVPVVPEGASWGESRSWKNFGLRVLRDYSDSLLTDRIVVDTFMGTAATKDRGTIDSDGKFQPTETGSDSPILVRAVKLSLLGS